LRKTWLFYIAADGGQQVNVWKNSMSERNVAKESPRRLKASSDPVRTSSKNSRMTEVLAMKEECLTAT
jgi:hypothetical protein